MTIRRIVTGRRNARSVVLSDGSSPTEHNYEHIPGMRTSVLWSAESTPATDIDEAAPPGTRAIPEAGRSSFLIVEFPPDSVAAAPDFALERALGEQAEHVPGFVECFDPAAPGMHTTPTLDYGVVLSGAIWLELDDGHLTELRAGDAVVQQGTRHAWRNLGSEPARLAFVLTGSAS